MPLQSDLFFVCEAIRSLFEADTATCVLADDDASRLRVVAADGRGADALIGTEMPYGEGVTGWIGRTGLPLLVEDLDADDRYRRDVAQRTGYHPTRFMGAPLLADSGDCLGLLCVMDPEGDATQAGVDLQLLTVAAAQVAELVLSSRSEDGTVPLSPARDAARRVDDVIDGLRGQRRTLRAGCDAASSLV